MAATTSSGGSSSKSKGAKDTSGTGLASTSGDSDNGATSGVEEEAIAEEVSAEEAMPDITELITGITGDDSILQMLYQIRGKDDDGLITTPNLDWTDENIDDVESYISSGEVGILRDYWTDSATATAVKIYYTVCDASPQINTVSDLVADIWLEDREQYQWDSLITVEEEETATIETDMSMGEETTTTKELHVAEDTTAAGKAAAALLGSTAPTI